MVATQNHLVKQSHVQKTFPSQMPAIDLLCGLLQHLAGTTHSQDQGHKTVQQV